MKFLIFLIVWPTLRFPSLRMIIEITAKIIIAMTAIDLLCLRINVFISFLIVTAQIDY